MADPTATTQAAPRFIKDASSPTVYDTAGGFLDPVSSLDELHQRGGNDTNLATVDSVQNYFPNLYKQQATARYQPQTDLAVNGLDQSIAGVDQGVTDENRSFDTLGQQLADAAKNATGTLTEQANNFGLLSSGLTAAGLGKIQSDLSKNQQNSAADHASNLAKLALQRAGLLTQEGQVKTAGAQNIQDLVNQLLSGSTAAQQNAFDQKQKLNAVSPLDLGNKIALIDSQGNIKQVLPKGLAPTAGSSSTLDPTVASMLSQIIGGGQGGGSTQTIQSPQDVVAELQRSFASGQGMNGNDSAIIQGIMQDTGLSEPEATKLYYDTRKPYETQTPAQKAAAAHPALFNAAPNVAPNPLQILSQEFGSFNKKLLPHN